MIRKNDKGELVSGDFTKYTPPLEVKQSDFRKKDPLAMNRKRPAIKKINKSISHLSTSAKMEVYSFDLDPNASGCADRCDYGINKVCYVLNNHNENYPSRKTKLARNLEFIKSNKFDLIKYEILKTRQRQFRWFSAGDIPDLESFKKIIKVCKQLPAVEFWLPTSRDDILIEYFEKGKGTIPKNLIIRYSAPQIAQSMPAFMVDLLKKWGVTYTETTMDATKATCHASIDGGSCELCEDCFKLIPITYLIHGVQARKNTDDLMEFRK